MRITFFLRPSIMGISIQKHFLPLIEEIKKTQEVNVYFLPSAKSKLKNLWFVYKHRDLNGINHITGDCHYVVLALLGCKSVLTIHDLVFYNYLNFSPLVKWVLYQQYIYWPVKLATRVIAITNKTRDEIEKTIPFKRQIDVVRHVSVDDFVFSPRPMNKSHIVILHNGTEPRKHLESTMRAVAKLGYELIVIRKMTDEQIELAKQLNLKYTNVYDLSDEELVQQYVESDIVCFPSSYEGFGAITLEGQAIGRPVITTDMEPMRSIANEAACLISDPTDYEELASAIMKVVNDDRYRENLIEKGLLNAKQYSLKNCAQEHIKLYKSII